MTLDETINTETTRKVLMDALVAVCEVDEPTPRKILRIMIRLECAHASLPRPDFDCFGNPAFWIDHLMPRTSTVRSRSAA